MEAGLPDDFGLASAGGSTEGPAAGVASSAPPPLACVPGASQDSGSGWVSNHSIAACTYILNQTRS